MSSQWEPGTIASRAGLRRFAWGKVIFAVAVVSAWQFPVFWSLEHLHPPLEFADGSSWSDLYPAAVAGALAVTVSASYWCWLKRGDRWRARNGTLVYAGAQPTADLDFDRVQYAFDAASRSAAPFDAPLRRRTDLIDSAKDPALTFNQLWKNLEYTLRPSKPDSPTNLVANYPWPYAVRLGYALAESRAKVSVNASNQIVLWHLAEAPAAQRESGWLVGELTDVISEIQLRSPDQIDRIADLREYPPAPAPEIGDPRILRLSLGLEPVGPAPHRGLYLGDTPTAADSSVPGSKPMAEPREFADLARSCAEVIVDALQVDQPQRDDVVVYARVPKAVAMAIGMALFSLTQIDLGDQLSRLVFMSWKPGHPPYEELRLWRESP